MHLFKRPLVMLLVLIAASMFVVACGDDDSKSDDSKADKAMTETEETTTDEAMSDDGEMAMGDKTIAALASENPDLSTLVELATAAGLVETLSGEDQFTVFAPTNEAFAKLPAATIADLKKPANKEKLVGILTYHAVPGMAMSSDLTDGQELTTANGATLKVSIDGDTVKIGDATVVTPDVKASNGVVHVIDTVLMPPAAPAGGAAGSTNG